MQRKGSEKRAVGVEGAVRALPVLGERHPACCAGGEREAYVGCFHAESWGYAPRRSCPTELPGLTECSTFLLPHSQWPCEHLMSRVWDSPSNLSLCCQPSVSMWVATLAQLWTLAGLPGPSYECRVTPEIPGSGRGWGRAHETPRKDRQASREVRERARLKVKNDERPRVTTTTRAPNS